jgi:transcriptional regulator with XRE-family HTH domain
MTSVSQNIVNLRKRLGLSQQEVADYLGVTHTIISNYENEKYPLTDEHLSKLADLFDLDIADLLEESAENKLLNIAFAFRADEISSEDITPITQFKKIIRNYLKLHAIEAI